MEWADRGIVLGVRKHGETSVIAEIMTRAPWAAYGAVQGGQGPHAPPALQPGNSVNAAWRARLEDHLGTTSLDAGRLRAARLMESAHATYAVQWLASLLRLLPERDAQPSSARHVGHRARTRSMIRPSLRRWVVRFESAILNELGFGLDLTACASTGRRDNLVHVPPRTGRAVSRDVGRAVCRPAVAAAVFLMSEHRNGRKRHHRRHSMAGIRLDRAFSRQACPRGAGPHLATGAGCVDPGD